MITTSPRSKRLRLLAVPLAAAASLLLPPASLAAPPVLTSVQYQPGVLTATWTLPPGTQASTLEASLSPKLDAEKGFANLDLFKELKPNALSVVVRQRIEPGKYYLHVGGSNLDCDQCPDIEYSKVMTFVVPPYLRKARPGTTYVGETSQGRRIAFKTAKDGKRIKRGFNFEYEASCGGGVDAIGKIKFETPVVIGRDGSFSIEIDDRGARLRLKGRFSASAEIEGTLSHRFPAPGAGTCRTGRLKWSAEPAWSGS